VLIDGKATAATVRQEIKVEIERIKTATGKVRQTYVTKQSFERYYDTGEDYMGVGVSYPK
jgi:5,10-methylene-tetrahydrofolate dehydrogenase/methenyl tetrahydrofolate cyclohydrolase